VTTAVVVTLRDHLPPSGLDAVPDLVSGRPGVVL
jgi:hypothetical protein